MKLRIVAYVMVALIGAAVLFILSRVPREEGTFQPHNIVTTDPGGIIGPHEDDPSN